MNVVIALVFFSLVLVSAALAFFISRLKEGDFEHEERLSLLPLLADDGAERPGPAAGDLTQEDDPAHASN